MEGAPVKVAVLGVGLIGGSIGLAARRRLGAEVTGWGHRAATVERAVALGALDRAAATAAEACAGADIVFCAAPVAALPGLVEAALAAVGPDTAVTDAGSTKRELVAAFGGDERFIGGHPLAGAETAGVDNAREDLFDGARWYLTPTDRTSGLLYDRLQRAVAGLGARPQAIDAAVHDRMMATVSHLPHVLANALAAEAAGGVAAGGGAGGGLGGSDGGPGDGDARSGPDGARDGPGASDGGRGDGGGRRDARGRDDGPERLPEVGPSFRDATRVAGSNPEIWADIFLTNRDAVAATVESVARRLEGAAALIRGGDREAIHAWHAAAGEDRRRLLDADLPGGPLQELRISLPNRPGTIAELALALGEAGVNIEDMALHPAADNHSGAVSLWVAGAEQAERAATRVRDLGHTVAVQGAGD